MAYNTNNPVGSTDPRDLFDNAGNMDKFENGPNPFYPDRFGVQKLSRSGMIENYNNMIDGQESAFSAAQSARESEFSSFLDSSGFVSLGNYTGGLGFTRYNEYMARGGFFYRPAPSSLPFTTTGTWDGADEDLFVLFSQDDVLRQDLAGDPKAGGGALLVGGSVVYVNSFAELMNIPTGSLVEGRTVSVLGTIFKFSSGSWEPITDVNAAIFGLHPDNTPVENSGAIDAALAYCAGRAKLYIPPVLHYIARTIELPSNTFIFSDGKDNIVFKMEGTVRRGEMLMVTGHRGVHKTNITIQGFGIDSNRDRWTVADNSSVYMDMTPTGAWYERNLAALSGSGLVVCNSSNVRVLDFKSIDAYSHCIDVTAPSDGRGQSSAVLYDPEPSYDVVIDDVVVSGHGDDGVTTHQSHDIFIDRVVSLGASGVKVQINANGVEIDDGSRDITVGTIKAFRCTHALSVQGHTDSPAPYNISVGSVTAINCVKAAQLTHTGWDSETDPSGISGGDGSGRSPTARCVSIDRILCIAPRQTEFFGVVELARGAISLQSYEDVRIGSIVCTDSVDDLAVGIDGVLPSTPLAPTAPFLVGTYGGRTRGVTIGQVVIRGFNDADVGVRLAPRYGKVIVGSLICENGPKTAFQDSTLADFGGTVSLLSYDVRGNHIGEGTVAIRHSGRAGSVIGPGTVVGYDVKVSGSSAADNSYVGEYNISDGPSDVRQLGYGAPATRLRVGNTIRSTTYLTGATLNTTSAGGAFAWYSTSGVDELNTSKMVIAASESSFRPGSDGVLSCGLSAFRWSQVYAATGTINTSDEREKEQIGVPSDVVLDAWATVEFAQYKFRDAVAAKGGGARWHIGVVAQRVKEAFESAGLDPFSLGVLCYDVWDDEYEETVSEDGAVVGRTLTTQAGERYGVRYDEALALEAALMRRTTRRLEERLAALESKG